MRILFVCCCVLTLVSGSSKEPQFGDLELVDADGFDCKIPAAESLMYSFARGGRASALSASELVPTAHRLANRAMKRYEPEMTKYALGDCIKMLKKCTLDEGWGPDTLAAQYASRTNETNDFPLAVEIVDEYRDKHFVPEPPEHAFVIHLRASATSYAAAPSQPRTSSSARAPPSTTTPTSNPSTSS